MNKEEKEFIEKIALDNATYNVDSIGYPSRFILRKDIDTLLNIIYKSQQENQKLKDNWNKLKEEIKRLLNRQYDIDKFAEEQGFATYNPVKLNIEHIKNKMKELESSDYND